MKKRILCLLLLSYALNGLAGGVDENDEANCAGKSATTPAGLVVRLAGLDNPTSIEEILPLNQAQRIQRFFTWRDAFRDPELQTVFYATPYPFEMIREMILQYDQDCLPKPTFGRGQYDSYLLNMPHLNRALLKAQETPLRPLDYVPNGVAQLWVLYHVSSFLSIYAYNVEAAVKSPEKLRHWQGVNPATIRVLTLHLNGLLETEARHIKEKYFQAMREKSTVVQLGGVNTGSENIDPLLQPFSGSFADVFAALPMSKIQRELEEFRKRHEAMAERIRALQEEK